MASLNLSRVLLLLAGAALCLAPRAQTAPVPAEDEAASEDTQDINPQTAREAILRHGGDAIAPRELTAGFDWNNNRFAESELAPWGQARAGTADFRYAPEAFNFQLNAAMNDHGGYRLDLRGVSSWGGRLDLQYRRVQRNLFDDAPVLLDRGGMPGGAASIYTGVIPSLSDPDGVWNPGALAALTPLARAARAQIRRDLFSLDYVQRLPGAGDLTVGVELQRRRGYKPWSFVQATDMQVFPGPDGFPFGEVKAVTGFLLPVDDREAGLHLGYAQVIKKFRISANLGWSRHEDDAGDLAATNPWPGRPALYSRLGQPSTSRTGELKMAQRLGPFEFTFQGRLDETRADIPVNNFTPFVAGTPFASSMDAVARKQNLKLGGRLLLGDWEFSVEGYRRRHYRTDLPVDFPEYEHPLGGAELGFNSPFPFPGLARTPHPMNGGERGVTAAVEQSFHAGALPLRWRAGYEHQQQEFTWRAVPGMTKNTGSLELSLMGSRGRLRLSGELSQRAAPAPVANFYETAFIGPDGALFGEPGQSLGFIAADLLGGHRVTTRISGDVDFARMWQIAGDASLTTDHFDEARLGLQSRQSRAGSLAVYGNFSPVWQWSGAISGQTDDTALRGSKQLGIETPDPLDPFHALPARFATRVSQWDVRQSLAWRHPGWSATLEGHHGGIQEKAAMGPPLNLHSIGGRMELRFRPKLYNRHIEIGANLDWRKIDRNETDALPTLTSAPINDPVSGLPAPDIFLPLPSLGPQGWAAGFQVRWILP
jgi:hypothetical protein